MCAGGALITTRLKFLRWLFGKEISHAALGAPSIPTWCLSLVPQPGASAVCAAPPGLVAGGVMPGTLSCQCFSPWPTAFRDSSAALGALPLPSRLAPFPSRVLKRRMFRAVKGGTVSVSEIRLLKKSPPGRFCRETLSLTAFPLQLFVK